MMAEVAGPKRMGRVMGIVVDAGDARADPRPGRRRADPRRTCTGRGSSSSTSRSASIAIIARLADAPRDRLRRGRAARRASAWRCCPTGAAADRSTASPSSARPARFSSTKVVVPDHRRHRPDRGVLPARAAHRAPAARRPPVRQPTSSSAPRSRPSASAPRCSAAMILRAALLPGGPPRERDRHGPADRPAGARRCCS